MRPRRFERLTYSFGGCCSIQLSYGRPVRHCFSVAWKHMKCLGLPAVLAGLFCTALLFAHAQTASGPCPSAAVKDHGQAVNGKALASPAAVATVQLEGKALSIHYNSPSVRCRTIMGDLVPYGKVWRTGANPATSFTTEVDLTIGTLRVPAGQYTLYTLPAAANTPWMLIVNKQTGQWGTQYDPAQDLGRTPMHGEDLPSSQEVMSLSFEKSTSSSTQLHVRWEKADESVELRLAR